MADKFDKTCIVAVNAAYTHSSLSARCLFKALDDNALVCEYTINDNISKVAAELYKNSCSLYAFSCYIWNIEFILDVCRILKAANPNCIILLGGPEVSYDAVCVMREHSFVDFIICGEGETALKEFISGKDCEKIGGLVYRKGTNIIQNDIAPIINLDELERLYTKDELSALENKMVYYETSRGCPYRCSYCLSSTSHGVRFFSLERVFEDFKLFIECGVKLIKLTDRTFNIDKERTKQILRFILDNNKQTCFHFEISADIMDDEMIELLNSAPRGFFQLEIGVQSTNEKTLCAIDRKANTEKLIKNIKELQKRHNMHIHLDLIAGLPYEDYESFKNSFNEVFALRSDMLQLGFLKLLKGTKIRNEAEKYGYVFNQKPPYEVISNNFISYYELLKLKDVCEIVEKYYNSASFEKSLEMALGFFDNAYDFFYEFAKFWSKNAYDKRAQSKKALYDIFLEFYKSSIGENTDLFCELLKFDFIKNNKNAALPIWAPRTADKAFYTNCYEFLKSEKGAKYIPLLSGAKLCEIMRNVKVERFNFDVLKTLNFGECVIIFDYENNTFTKIEEKF